MEYFFALPLLLFLTSPHSRDSCPAPTLQVTNIAISIFAQADNIGSFKFEKTERGHTAAVLFHTKSFERAEHKITRGRQQQTRVDGRPAIGTDGNIPSVEIDSIKLVFDGKQIDIPKSLFADCFEPHFGHAELTVKFGARQQSLLVSMSGSDGAGGYEVTWRLKPNGQHTRSIKQGF